jgi:hypothetical protein
MTEVIENTRGWRRVCPRHYSASRSGHAPGYLSGALVEAIEASFWGGKSWWEVLEINFVDPAEQRSWDRITALERAAWLLGQLWNCTDILGALVCSTADLTGNKTVAQFVRILKVKMVESRDL